MNKLSVWVIESLGGKVPNFDPMNPWDPRRPGAWDADTFRKMAGIKRDDNLLMNKLATIEALVEDIQLKYEAPMPGMENLGKIRSLVKEAIKHTENLVEIENARRKE